MIFNSFEFFVFLPIVFVLYWFVFNKKLKWQNLLLLVTSYIFYGWWDWRFLSLIVFSSFIDFHSGLQIVKAHTRTIKKRWLTFSIFVNLGFLGVFKYYNFFANSLYEAFLSVGFEIDVFTLDIVLPVGISFYTFQTMSYTIDVYRNKLKPTTDPIAFFAFVSFFPQLVAGPIERANNLLPQFYKFRKFEYHKAVDGLRQILWGLFKKVVVADNCAKVVNLVFNNSEGFNGSSLWIAAVFFAFQIYGDFSGYSDIAIGTSRLFGFNLKQNFAFPYFSRDIAEFWRNWHISLSTWFRDYVYIPLGGSKGNIWNRIRNTLIIFTVSGFWHGANWTFIVWGIINAIYFLPLLLLKRNRKNTNVVAENSFFPNWKELSQMSFTFFITIIAWVFFRANTIKDAFVYIRRLFLEMSFQFPQVALKPIAFIGLLLIIEWLNRRNKHGLVLDAIRAPILRWGIYFFILIVILFYAAPSQEFIYFQF
ncbi:MULTISPECIES: MBOAT family O-acyltransferase [Flavobacteriaceae]|uniref:MBOAT family protein n=2 Tax=Flavobacteriaceae TaxID=49546 RepID=A0A4Y8ATS3_9FLAO|nr:MULTISPECIES: MBOAT family O-acyltransferase [Flavobacteriaceae]TEW75238.1 MBOAT family protein [Gramella jeungdoensis]GGK60435.1 O-acyltransferase [Lutibacter litoralis]